MEKKLVEWAAQHDISGLRQITYRPWSHVYRGLLSEEKSVIVKYTTHSRPDLLKTIAEMSDAFPGRVPKVIAHDIDSNFFIYEDVKDTTNSRVNFETTLNAHAEIQVLFAQNDRLCDLYPRLNASDLIEENEALVGGSLSLGPSNLYRYLSPSESEKARNFFATHRELLNEFAKRVDASSATIDHADLSSEHVFRRASGAITIIDWDDAVFSAPGWALRRSFDDISDIVNALSHEDHRYSQALKTYIDPFVKSGLYARDELEKLLPAAAVMGKIYLIVSFVHYPMTTETGYELSMTAKATINRLHQYFKAFHP